MELWLKEKEIIIGIKRKADGIGVGGKKGRKPGPKPAIPPGKCPCEYHSRTVELLMVLTHSFVLWVLYVDIIVMFVVTVCLC